MRLVLVVPPGQSERVVGFNVARHLGRPGQPADAAPFVEGASKRALSDSALGARLSQFGVGEITLRVSGTYIPRGRESDPEAELPWSEEGTVQLGLDLSGLASAIHVLQRKFLATFPPGETPPIIFVSRIELENAPEREEYRVRFRDRQTGRLVSRATWERSRRSIRARAGKSRKRAPGRYVRERYKVRP